eukprot:SAG25_NODE_2230_length_1815_cov_18.002914_2_plen_415_part_00
MAESAGRRPSVSSQPVSRPSTPRIDVAAVLAAAQRNRERCRAVVGEARAYRRPRTARRTPTPEPEPEPEPVLVPTGGSADAAASSRAQRLERLYAEGDSESALSSSSHAARVAGAAAARPSRLGTLGEGQWGQTWSAEQSDELAEFDPLSAASRTLASPPPSSSSSSRPPRGGRGRRQRPGGGQGEAGMVQQAGGGGDSRQRRALTEVQDFAAASAAADEEAAAEGAAVRGGGIHQLVMQDVAEAKGDDEYTEGELREIEDNQRKLADGFEQSISEIERMLEAGLASDSALEKLSSQMAQFSSRLQQTRSGVSEAEDMVAVAVAEEAVSGRRVASAESAEERPAHEEVHGQQQSGGAAGAEAAGGCTDDALELFRQLDEGLSEGGAQGGIASSARRPPLQQSRGGRSKQRKKKR